MSDWIESLSWSSKKKEEYLVTVSEGGMRRGFTNRHCPKCNGNIFVDQDSYYNPEESYYGWYEWCLQCGLRRDLKPADILEEELNLISTRQELITV